MRTKHICVGIIAEDDSDVDCVRVLIKRIADNERIGVKKFVGKGCGRIKRKCNAWADQLKSRGCTVLILVHDLDRANYTDLERQISSALSPSPIKKHFICLPVQELEAWLISDPDAISRGLKLRKVPRVPGNPETIDSPKEYLGDLISKISGGEKVYLNTKHNEMIATELSLDCAKNKCPSFDKFHSFIAENIPVMN